jgi:hypothetical protein
VSESEQQIARKRFLLYQVPYLVLYVAALGLVAMTAHDAADTSGYWQMFIPLVALVSILGGWRFAGGDSRSRWIYIGKQVLHWGAVVLVIRLLYSHNVHDFLNDEQDGFVIIYILGLSALLSGIYLDWKMALFGGFLLFSAAAFAWLSDNALLMTLLGVGVLAAAITLMVRGRMHKSSASG